MVRFASIAFALVFAAATPVYAGALTEEQVEGVEAAIKALGCTVEEDNIEAKGDGYAADDVECKDGNYDMVLDKDFKIVNKEKEEE
ncbi:MAG TPA: hypothetical protein VNJ31_00495 [Methyloceanibacter sp.]|nr:hypothetical protein [Methyloceanibacter sp.]